MLMQKQAKKKKKTWMREAGKSSEAFGSTSFLSVVLILFQALWYLRQGCSLWRGPLQGKTPACCKSGDAIFTSLLL